MRIIQIGSDTWIDIDRFIGATTDKAGAGTVVIYLEGIHYQNNVTLTVREEDWRALNFVDYASKKGSLKEDVASKGKK